jgi:hypothetical protein
MRLKVLKSIIKWLDFLVQKIRAADSSLGFFDRVSV